MHCTARALKVGVGEQRINGSEESRKLSLGRWQGLQLGIPAGHALQRARRLEFLLGYYKSSGLSGAWSSHIAYGNNASHCVPCKILRTNEIMNSP